jgi:hypothetical protein
MRGEFDIYAEKKKEKYMAKDTKTSMQVSGGVGRREEC